MQIDSLLKLHYRQFLELVISPDDLNALVVFGNGDMPHEHYAYDERNRSIWRCELNKEDEISMLVSYEEDAHAPAWSTTGDHIAYISRVSGRPEIWIMNNDGSHRRQVSHLNGFTGRDALNGTKLLWSPDDAFIAFNAVPCGGLYGLWQDIEKADKDKVRLSNVVSVSRKSRSSGDDAFERASSVYEGAICRLDLHSGEVISLVSQKGQGFKLIDWLSNGEHLVCAVGSDIEVVNVTTGARKTVCSGLAHPYSVKVIGDSIHVATATQTGLRIGQVIDGIIKSKREVTVPGFDIQPHSWTHDGTLLFVSSTKGVSNILFSVSTLTGHVEQLTEDGHVVFSYDHRCGVHALHLRHSAVFPYGSPNDFTELWNWEHHGEPRLKQVSNFNKELIAERKPISRIISYSSGDFLIEAILVLPPDFTGDKPFPTLVFVHGGPETHVNASFTELISARAESAAVHLANHGYVVLLPNCRGSDGYGTEFESEIGSYQTMSKPYQDIMCGIDYLIEQGITDGNFVGIYGSSYGAQVAAWTISQTSRFNAAVCAVGERYDALFPDRYYGGSFLTYRETRKGNAETLDIWTKPELMRQISPIEYVVSVDTPVLLVETSGEREDGYSYALPYFNGLTSLGKEAYLVYYPEAFHTGGWNDDYKKDYMRRLVCWFDYCLKGLQLPEWFIEPTNSLTEEDK